jgi:beta-glucanase (GH16 family)
LQSASAASTTIIMFLARPLRAAATAALLAGFATAQTSTDCNPTHTTCDADPALGMAINVDFTQGEVNSFTASGGTPKYGPDGVTFTITKPGDAPQLNSVFYIMFGRVDITLKCAPGTGIVTSVVLQSDDLDEIDLEFLGVDNSQVQTMYFGKGQRAPDPLVYASAPSNQDRFVTYSLDWTSDRIVWSVGGSDVRVLEASTYPAYYPQTPMQLKFGIWAGGDPSNPEGTVAWAGGSTDYSQGPFSATVQKVAVTDYSTGTKYSYGDMSGTWKSIKSEGGDINANADQAAKVTTVTGSTTSTGSANFPGSGIVAGSSTAASSVDAIPSGWRMTSSGKIVPNSSTAVSTFKEEKLGGGGWGASKEDPFCGPSSHPKMYQCRSRRTRQADKFRLNRAASRPHPRRNSQPIRPRSPGQRLLEVMRPSPPGTDKDLPLP